MMTLEPPRGVKTEAEGWSALGLSRVGLTRFFRAAQERVGLRGDVDVLLAGDRTLRRLNREFRGKDKATDVLSFPAPAEISDEHAGDLAISFETAARQAAEQGHALGVELRVLMLHGLLHLAGMDHEVDGGEMAAREAVLRGELRLPRGLIARALSSRSPSGMTTRKARSKATATATAEATATATAKTTAEANAKYAKLKREVRKGAASKGTARKVVAA